MHHICALENRNRNSLLWTITIGEYSELLKSKLWKHAVSLSSFTCVGKQLTWTGLDQPDKGYRWCSWNDTESDD